MSSANILLLLVKAPKGFSLALPPADKNGKPTATTTQLAIHDALEAAFIEWNIVGGIKTRDLYRVVARATLPQIEGLIAKFKLPLTVMHAQDAYEHQTGTTTAPDGAITPVTATTVYKQGHKATLLHYMPDVVTYDANGAVLSQTRPTVLTLPNCQDMAPWQI